MTQHVLDRLAKVKQGGHNQWTALCPSHEDTERSLSIGQGRDGKILVKCFKGCSFKEIVAGLKMEAKDFFKNKKRERYSHDYDYY